MSKLKILIAEDDKSIQALYRKGLSPDFFEPLYISNGREALEFYRSWRPDIIILDIMLPEVTGYTVLREIREMDQDLSTTIIMVSSMSYESDIRDCQKFSIQGYIAKPFNYREIGTRIIQCHQDLKEH